MWQTLGLALTGIAALIGALASVLKMNRTVPAGSVGIVFRYHEPMSRQWPDENGELRWGYWYVLPGKLIWWMLPGVHSLKFVPVYERNTDDVTIALQRTDGSVWLTRIILTYDLTYKGVEWAICRTPDNFSFQVSSFFHDLVGDVLAVCNDDGRDEIRYRILETAIMNGHMGDYGIGPTRVTIAELSRGPMTQLADTLREILVQGGSVRAYGDVVTAVRDAVLSELRSSRIE